MADGLEVDWQATNKHGARLQRGDDGDRWMNFARPTIDADLEYADIRLRTPQRKTMIPARRLTVAFLGLIWFAGRCAAAEVDDSKAPVLIYFGASNCPVCRDWKRFDLPKLKETESFKAARFVEIQKEIPAPIPGSDKFPPELAAYRDAIAESFKGKVGSPMFAVVVGDKVTWSYRGAPSNQQVVKALQAALKS